MIHEMPSVRDDVADVVKSAYKGGQFFLPDRPSREERIDLTFPVLPLVSGELYCQGAGVDCPAKECEDLS